jgi:predicted NAD/FAD-dependent oxidoreductase
MAKATHARGAKRAVSSHWNSDPDARGAYSYLRVGATPGHRERLTGEVLPGLWLAGEATSVAHPATMHGAWFSGERAADAVLAGDARDVLVIGAGLAGLAAARRLAAGDRAVTVLEARAHAGGRVAVDTTLGIPLPLGAAWLHGEIGHPLASLVAFHPDDWDEGHVFVSGHGAVGAAAQDHANRVYDVVRAQLAESTPDVTAGLALARALDAHGDLDSVVRDVVTEWITSEIENLFGAPLDDFAPGVGFEPYGLPGDDCIVTSSFEPAIAALADPLDITYRHRVTRLARDAADGTWTTDTGRRATAVIVTVPVAVLAAGAIEFSPPLPDTVTESLRLLGTGPITKLFATYDTRWWPIDSRPLRTVGTELRLAVDITELTGVPVLCWFATGDAARRIEHMSEHEQCVLVDRVSKECGLTVWDG